jgi:hypothetical protein
MPCICRTLTKASSVVIFMAPLLEGFGRIARRGAIYPR